MFWQRGFERRSIAIGVFKGDALAQGFCNEIHCDRCLKRRYLGIRVLKGDTLPQISWKEIHWHRGFETRSIVTSVLKGDTLAQGFWKAIHWPNKHLKYSSIIFFITSIDLIKENGLTLRNTRSRRYPAENITDADYADDLVLLANTPAQTESLLHRLDQETGGIGINVNANKTESRVISILSDESLTLVTSLHISAAIFHAW